jgi:regulatory protein
MKKATPSEARAKILRYCAYQERSHLEVRNKLYEFGLSRDEVNEILTYLILEGFLNEERFARSFAGGKFRMKKWGRLKIVRELEAKGVSKNCIKAGLQEVEGDDYMRVLEDILRSKSTQLSEPNIFVLRDKTARYAIQKGFEPDLVWEKLKEILPDQ